MKLIPGRVVDRSSVDPPNAGASRDQLDNPIKIKTK